jgi:hypothetical protein
MALEVEGLEPEQTCNGHEILKGEQNIMTNIKTRQLKLAYRTNSFINGYSFLSRIAQFYINMKLIFDFVLSTLLKNTLLK